MAPGLLVEPIPDENGMSKGEKRNGEVVIGDMEHDGRVILYIIKADETSYINYIKPLVLAQELGIPHVLSVIDTTSHFAYKIHPERMVPALKDKDPVTGEQINVFEGTACLQYLADRFDVNGNWTGRTAAERGAVYTWTAYQTAGIGLRANTIKQWDILNQRLAPADQTYIALKDRPSLADLSYFPFAMPRMFGFLGVDIKDWPHIEAWHRRMAERPAFKDIMARAATFGHDMTEEQARELKEAV